MYTAYNCKPGRVKTCAQAGNPTSYLYGGPTTCNDDTQNWFSDRYVNTYVLTSMDAHHNAPYWGRTEVAACNQASTSIGYYHWSCPYAFAFDYGTRNNPQPCTWHEGDNECLSLIHI